MILEGIIGLTAVIGILIAYRVITDHLRQREIDRKSTPCEKCGGLMEFQQNGTICENFGKPDWYTNPGARITTWVYHCGPCSTSYLLTKQPWTDK
jgi:hypothetical protein